MMNAPLVSVLMPIYNTGSYAAAAIQSILDQTFTDFEFIIVDDGSNIETKTLLADYAAVNERIVLVCNERNLGITRSLNRGLSLARGKYVARQDSDDVSLPRRLEIQVTYLQSHTEVGLLGSAYKIIDSDGTIIETRRVPEADTAIRWQMLFENVFCHTTVVFRSSLLSKHNLKYDEALTYSQDYALWAKMMTLTKAANLPDELVYLRRHEESVSVKHYEIQRKLATIVAEEQMRHIWSKNPFTISDIDTLRQWYSRFPQQLTKQDMILCKHLLHMIARFGQQTDVNYAYVAHINLRWTRCIQRATGRYDQWGDLIGSGLLLALIRYSLPAAVINMPAWLGRKAKRGFRILSKANSQEE